MRFSPANSKLQKTARAMGIAKRNTYAFNILAGHDCPFARECRSQINVVDGKRRVVDGPSCRFRCYGASMESRLRDVFALHQANSKEVRATLKSGGFKLLASKLDAALDPSAELVRIHSDAGDFFSRAYFRAWMKLASMPHRRGCRFYFYTKALPYIVGYADQRPWADLERGYLSANVRFTASRGGSHDHLIDTHQMREATVVFSEEEATREIDSDDTHAARSGGSFNLLLHAAQPAGTPAAVAWEKLRRAKTEANKQMA